MFGFVRFKQFFCEIRKKEFGSILCQTLVIFLLTRDKWYLEWFFIEHLYGTSQKKDAFRGCNSQMFRFQLVRHVESVNIFFWQHLNTSNVALGCLTLFHPLDTNNTDLGLSRPNNQLVYHLVNFGNNIRSDLYSADASPEFGHLKVVRNKS